MPSDVVVPAVASSSSSSARSELMDKGRNNMMLISTHQQQRRKTDDNCHYDSTDYEEDPDDNNSKDDEEEDHNDEEAREHNVEREHDDNNDNNEIGMQRGQREPLMNAHGNNVDNDNNNNNNDDVRNHAHHHQQQEERVGAPPAVVLSLTGSEQSSSSTTDGPGVGGQGRYFNNNSNRNFNSNTILINKIPSLVMDKLLDEGVDKDSVLEALREIFRLCAHDDEDGIHGREALYEAGGHAAIVRSMIRWETCAYVQHICCMILVSVTAESTTFCRAAVKVGALKTIVAAMGRFTTSPGVQEHACLALEQMCFHSPVHRAALTNLYGATRYLIAAMENFPCCIHLQMSVCRILLSLSTEVPSRQSVEQAGGIIALAALVQRTRNSQDFAKRKINSIACTALSQLCNGLG